MARRACGGAALLLRLCLIEPELSAIDLRPGGIIQRLLLEVLPRTIDVELLGLEQLRLVHRDDVALQQQRLRLHPGIDIHVGGIDNRLFDR